MKGCIHWIHPFFMLYLSCMKTTEKESNHSNLESKSIYELVHSMNKEDQTVADAVANQMEQIAALAERVYERLKEGGRLFYIGSGTSGRLGVVDASECPPTFGVAYGVVVGVIAGGDIAIRKAVEKAEDDTEQGWKDLISYKISKKDIVVGLSASGSTPYVLGALKKCNENSIDTGCIVCNSCSDIANNSNFPIEVVVGPEFVTGSTRMKSGTAQKMVLNMISTSVMIKLGHVVGNRMVDMQLSNQKLVERGVAMICNALEVDSEVAKKALLEQGSVRKAIEYLDNK